jgi:hypothetical protein
MRRSSEYLEEGYGASYRVQNLTVSKMPYQHFFRTECAGLMICLT